MTRTTALKAVYFARFTASVLCMWGVLAAASRGYPILTVTLATLTVVLLLSGRLQAYYWSELLAGLHFLNQRDYVASKAHTERFLGQLRNKPWLRHLIWLGTSSYSTNGEVLALNNLGAAEIGLGRLDTARAHLDRAIALDPQCPLPYRNMFTLLMRQGPLADAKPWLEKAHALGLKGGVSDRMVQSLQRRNASFSTTGKASRAQPSAGLQGPPIIGAYVVNILNDDVTPLELVITALEQVFGMTGGQALGTALLVQKAGKAACAGFADEGAAQQKADELRSFVHDKGYRLDCIAEPR